MKTSNFKLPLRTSGPLTSDSSEVDFFASSTSERREGFQSNPNTGTAVIFFHFSTVYIFNLRYFEILR